MNLFTPEEMVRNYSLAGAKKAKAPAWKLLLLGVLAGALIGYAALVTNMACYKLENPSVVRIVSGVLFGFGLGLVILSGAELFTGNTLILISVLDKKATVPGMLRNWGLVYSGNLLGAFLLSFLVARFNHLGAGGGALAAYSMSVAQAKMTAPFLNALVMGILCNMLVVLGVLFSLAGKDGVSRIFGAWAPVMFFVTLGFNHCVADMTYCMTGLFAVRYYANHAAAFPALGWGRFLLGNLLPVTLGNIIGGCAIGATMWLCYLWSRKKEEKAEISS